MRSEDAVCWWERDAGKGKDAGLYHHERGVLSHSNEDSSEQQIKVAQTNHSDNSKARDIAFEMALLRRRNINLSKIATFVQISTAKIAVPLIPGREIVSSELHYLQDHTILQCFDFFIPQRIFLVEGVLCSFLASPFRDLEMPSTNLTASSILFGIFLELTAC